MFKKCLCWNRANTKRVPGGEVTKAYLLTCLYCANYNCDYKKKRCVYYFLEFSKIKLLPGDINLISKSLHQITKLTQKNCQILSFKVALEGLFYKRNSMTSKQILAKRGPDSRFVLEANIKSLCPTSSRSSTNKIKNCVHMKHQYKPGSKWLECY